MAEPLKDIRDWLEAFPNQGHLPAVGDTGLEIVVLDQFNREAGSFEIGGIPDWISGFADGAARELEDDGMKAEDAQAVAADAEHIIRRHEPESACRIVDKRVLELDDGREVTVELRQIRYRGETGTIVVIDGEELECREWFGHCGRTLSGTQVWRELADYAELTLEDDELSAAMWDEYKSLNC